MCKKQEEALHQEETLMAHVTHSYMFDKIATICAQLAVWTMCYSNSFGSNISSFYLVDLSVCTIAAHNQNGSCKYSNRCLKKYK